MSQESNVAGAFIHNTTEVWVEMMDGEKFLFRSFRTLDAAAYCRDYICDQFSLGASIGYVSVDQWADPMPIVIA